MPAKVLPTSTDCREHTCIAFIAHVGHAHTYNMLEVFEVKRRVLGWPLMQKLIMRKHVHTRKILEVLNVKSLVLRRIGHTNSL